LTKVLLVSNMPVDSGLSGDNVPLDRHFFSKFLLVPMINFAPGSLCFLVPLYTAVRKVRVPLYLSRVYVFPFFSLPLGSVFAVFFLIPEPGPCVGPFCS